MASIGNKRIDLKDALVFVLDGNDSDVSGFSSDGDDEESEDNPLLLIRHEASKETAGQSYDLKGNNEKETSDETGEEEKELLKAMKKHTYRRRKKEIPRHIEIFEYMPRHLKSQKMK